MMNLRSEEELSDFDISDSDNYEKLINVRINVSDNIRVNLDGLNMNDIEVRELSDSDDSETPNVAHEFDSDSKNWPKFYLKSDMNNPKLEVRLLFLNKDSLKEAAKQYGRRVKLRVVELFEGGYKAQYEKIYEYMLEACKDGYKDGCRRIIVLDGYFLNGYFGGYLLETIGIDANNGIYSILYVAIEIEYQTSWCWLLELLSLDLEIVSSYQISFRFRKQKGLVKAIFMLFPNVETRHCVRHLHANIKASTPRDFENAMVELKNTNQDSYYWLKGKNLAHWSSKCKKFGHNKRNCRGEVGQNLLVTRHTVGVHNQVATPTHQKAAPTHQEVARREKLPFKRKLVGQPTTAR
ncbi:hypothetical protein Gotri_001233 [Gossypium trilobum]|uniref:MULE transposase domain-containing protein n=1 Tax=Gossypium trilobum TaxID=34281 RepID=A0A7J9FEY5_9ROSI|nr:hypothetical protein [Gossypium trilobum]